MDITTIKTLDQILETSRQGEKVTVAVAAAQDEAALSAIVDAGRMGLAVSHLFGNEHIIRQLLAAWDLTDSDYLIFHHIPDPQVAVTAAVASAHTGQSQLLLKGQVKTADLLKAVLDKEMGLRTGRLLSDVFLFEYPTRMDNKLIMITDGGVNLKPDLNQKIEIIQNAVKVAQALGNTLPKVAILSAVETVVPNLVSTMDAATITKMNERGQIKDCIIDGPLALDNAISLEAARIKDIRSPVAGLADILLCPDIESANMLAKSTTYFAGLRLCHVLMGAQVPILIPSRADSAEAKLLSIALGKLVCQR